MRIVRHGIDMVEIARIEQMVREHGERFLARCFHPHERAYAQRGSGHSMERLAARFAAKEAAFKAMGTGWARGIAWTDVWVRSDNPAPALIVEGTAAEIAREQGITSWDVSLTHTGPMAAASVLAFGD